jgi:glyceraldehyde 3-phosphate dehydrogenase
MRVAINGFGRIGRLVLRAALGEPNLEIVAVNDVTDGATLAHLLKYDSVHGKLPGEVDADGEHLVVNGRRIRALAEREPKKLPWRDMEVEVVLESTGLFASRDKAAAHLDAGACRVIVSAPCKEADVTWSERRGLRPRPALAVSNASCTTNCRSGPGPEDH